MENITEGIHDFKTLEKIIFQVACKIGRELIEEYLNNCDKRLLALRDVETYRAVNSSTTTIKTIMGEVNYTRRRYKHTAGGYVFLLDEALGLNKDYGLVSENLAEQIIAESTEKSFRKSAESISSNTGQKISAMGTWGVLQRFGKKLDNQKERLEELNKNGVVGQLGKLQSKVLFEELDDVWISMQKEKRKKREDSSGKNNKESKKRPIHVGTAYTGWAKAKDGKYRIINKFAYAAFGTTAEFATSFETLLNHRYDMDGLQKRILCGDGAGWIKTVAENNDAIMQLDPFHRSRAVMKAISDKKDQKMIFEAIKDKDVGRLLNTIADLMIKTSDEAEFKRLSDLYNYFCKNKDHLLTWQEREIELPQPPDGVVYRNLGTQEASNCDLITQRMKHRKGSWSIIGGGHMAMILCIRHTIGLDEMLGMLPEPVGEVISSGALSAAKVPLCDGKGYDGAWLHANMPFTDVMMTNGRKAIQSLLRQRSISELRFI